MKRPFNPRELQLIGQAHLASWRRCGLLAGMGTGKTSTALHTLKLLTMVEDPFPALVLGPKRVAETTWPDELQKWEGFDTMSMTPGTGGFQRMVDALKLNPDIVTLNYDNVEKLVHIFGAKHWPFRTVIADESRKLAGFRLRGGGARAAALAKIAKRTPRWVNLTGLMLPNGVRDAWGQLWFIDFGRRLRESFTQFEEVYFKRQYDGTLVPHDWALKEIMERISDVCISLRAEDYFDLPPLITNNVMVDMPSKARAQYAKMERDFVVQLEAGEVQAFNAGVKTMKLLQIANGFLYRQDDEAEPEEFEVLHSEKLGALRSVLNEADSPLLVAYHFKADLRRILEEFPEARELDSDPATIHAWNRGEIPMLVAHPASAGHGLNLQDGGNNICFYGHWWSYDERAQIIERIGPTRQAQAGKNVKVFVHNIVARGTVDELVVARLDGKAKVNEVLMEGLCRRS